MQKNCQGLGAVWWFSPVFLQIGVATAKLKLIINTYKTKIKPISSTVYVEMIAWEDIFA